MPHILLIDNYDSFTYNLVQQLSRLGAPFGISLRVHRNDACTVDQALDPLPGGVVISPGPGGPLESGISRGVMEALPHHVPLLGVCLGHQTLAAHFGGDIIRAQQPVHGKTSLVMHSGVGVFAGITNPFRVARYHSLIVDRSTLPSELEMTAWTEEGEIMALHHTRRPWMGVQFHPESFLTEEGDRLASNFLALMTR